MHTPIWLFLNLQDYEFISFWLFVNLLYDEFVTTSERALIESTPQMIQTIRFLWCDTGSFVEIVDINSSVFSFILRLPLVS